MFFFETRCKFKLLNTCKRRRYDEKTTERRRMLFGHWHCPNRYVFNFRLRVSSDRLLSRVADCSTRWAVYYMCNLRFWVGLIDACSLGNRIINTVNANRSCRQPQTFSAGTQISYKICMSSAIDALRHKRPVSEVIGQRA